MTTITIEIPDTIATLFATLDELRRTMYEDLVIEQRLTTEQMEYYLKLDEKEPITLTDEELAYLDWVTDLIYRVDEREEQSEDEMRPAWNMHPTMNR